MIHDDYPAERGFLQVAVALLKFRVFVLLQPGVGRSQGPCPSGRNRGVVPLLYALAPDMSIASFRIRKRYDSRQRESNLVLVIQHDWTGFCFWVWVGTLVRSLSSPHILGFSSIPFQKSHFNFKEDRVINCIHSH